jgi:NhaP-type Na+/H+ or K+/H+ antiporter
VDNYILILLVIGLLLLFITLGSGRISRLPLSYALIYLLIGIFLSPYGINLLQIRPQAAFLERLTEMVVIVSLFSCGLKMNRPLTFRAWHSTIRLIALLMPISIFAIAFLADWLLGMDFGSALLLGAILAPTDPVLASEVQLQSPDDPDELRFGLTSEGGLNDALAFPFVYFGLYWLKDERWQNWFWSWVAVDLIWACVAGSIMGVVVAKAIVWLDQRLERSNFDAMDELMEVFVALSIILLTYSLTELVNGYGFLAVFVAGFVTQQSYHNPEKPYTQLEFTERIEKLLEVGTILLLGSLLRLAPLQYHFLQALLMAGALFFVIRPLGAWLSTIGDRFPLRRWLFGWFGVRGVGSLYYLFYALGKGLKDELGEQVAWITFTTIVISIILHGTSATPIMRRYERRIAAQKKRQAAKSVL